MLFFIYKLDKILNLVGVVGECSTHDILNC